MQLIDSYKKVVNWLTLYLLETPFNTFANRADADQAALTRAACTGSTQLAYRNMLRYDPTLVDLASSYISSMYKRERLFI